MLGKPALASNLHDITADLDHKDEEGSQRSKTNVQVPDTMCRSEQSGTSFMLFNGLDSNLMVMGIQKTTFRPSDVHTVLLWTELSVQRNRCHSRFSFSRQM